MDNENQRRNEDVPEELYAPLGDNVYEKPKKEVVPEYVSYKDVELDFAKKPFNVKKVLHWIVGIFIFALLGIAGFLYVKNKKNVYRVWLNTETKKVTSTLTSLFDSKPLHLSQRTPFLTSFLVDFSSDYNTNLVTKEEKELLDTLKNTNISYTLGLDLKKKVLTHTLKSTYGDENLFTIYGNGAEDTLSFLIREVTGKYIAIPNYFQFLFITSKTEKKDIENFRKYIVNLLLKTVNEEDFEEESVTLTIDGKKEKLRAISLHLKKENIKKIFLDLCEKLEKNKTWKEKITAYFNLSETKIQSFLDKLKQIELEDTTIQLYAKPITNQIRKVKIKYMAEDIYEFEKQEGLEQQWELKKNGQTLFSLTSDEEKLKGVILGNTIKIQKEKDSLYTYFLEMKEDSYSGTVQIEDTELELSKKGTLHFKIEHQNELGEEISHLNFSIIYNTNTVETISLYKDEEQMSYADLSDADKEEIKNRIQKTETVSQVLKVVKKWIKKIGK